MGKQWHVLYYETINRNCPIQEFIDNQNKRNQAKILSFFSLLEERGPTLPRPYADLLQEGIHELRIKLQGKQTRVLYFFSFKSFIILTHAFVKPTGKVPKGEIKKAIKYRDDFLNRADEKQLKELFDEKI
jgi:hypothetical protein